jgi:alpha,alpha-trehalase
MDEIMRSAEGKQLFIFLDYDGTLTPIVNRPEDADLDPGMRETLDRLSGLCAVAVISGRDLADVRNRVGIGTIYYAGSHGFDIAAPDDRHLQNRKGTKFEPVLDQAESALQDRLGEVEGAQVERKRFSIAVHYRNVEESLTGDVEGAVEDVAASYPELRKSHGKKVYELQPDIDWHKGKAMLWLLEILEPDLPDVFPVYVGDDTTDEDAFRTLEKRGIGVVVEQGVRETKARYKLEDPEEVRMFLERLISLLEEDPR